MSQLATIEQLDPRSRLALIQAEQKRRHYLLHPEDWIKDKCGDFLWSKQVEICQAVVRHQKVAVASSFSTGKSHVMARLVCWWIDVNPLGEAFAVTTAASEDQVKTILWKEIGRAHAAAKLQGRVNQMNWHIKMPNGNEEQVAMGRKPADYNTVTFQGIHAPKVLVVLDEAAGVHRELCETADSALITNENCRIVMIGNPTDNTSKFAENCLPNSGWHFIRIPYDVTPNFTDEEVPDKVRQVLISRTWVEDKRRTWGEDNPLWISKALAQFPDTREGGLIPLPWIEAAKKRELPTDDTDRVLGVDVGGGGDHTIIGDRRGGNFRVYREYHYQDTMKTTGAVVDAIGKLNPGYVNIDSVGIGKGVADRCKELGHPAYAVNVGAAPLNKAAKRLYLNLRAQSWWLVREAFERGEIDIDPNDEELEAQLLSIRFFPTSAGKIQIEGKKELRREGKPSPDRADALMLTFLPRISIPKRRLTFGKSLIK